MPNGDSRQRIRRFAVDYCYDPKQPETCTQDSVYQDVGKEILDSMFDGYNACVLAYGHSASGKTYTMMGDEDDPGLTPRICQGLFRRMYKRVVKNPQVQFHTVVSFLEIYNERVRDLLVSDDSGATAGNTFSLRVREHPKLGPYVQDLSQHVVNNEERILEYLSIGNSRRSTAATENNIHSSRSHAVFTIKFRQSDERNFESELSSKVHLVDLAGSLQDTSQPQVKNERAGSAQSKTRLKEGANINKSLVTLGNVISALAESCETFINSRDQPITKSWQPFVPYRDSVLTWLLKDTLGGNSNTIMIATVSPASSCLNETINTLRYAKRTKRIVNQPIINEDPKIRTIRELREEIEKLRNVILTLQVNERISSDDDVLSSDCIKEENVIVNIPEKKFKESSDRVNNCKCEEDNGCSIIRDVRNDAVSGLDILPDLGAASGRSNAEIQGSGHQIGITTPSANSLSVDVSKINDEKKTDVNGAVIDKPAHESQVFSDSLGNCSAVSTKETSHGDIFDSNCFVRCNSIGYGESKLKKRRPNHKTRKDNQSPLKISRTSKHKICSRRRTKGKLKLYLKRECYSLENLSPAKMLHRSRPDLIKGIASHSKEGLPTTSSQSFTDVSGLSQSTSENSLNSSGSVESQTSENKRVKCWPEKSKVEEKASLKFDEAMQKSNSRQSSIGDGSGPSTPTQIPKLVAKRRADKRSEIVAAVTTRLYASKKKPDARLEALQTVEKYDEDEGELEELKLCKRARMKLFDLSRKLAMTKRIKRTTDSDTQTDFGFGTIRVKEKSVATDQSGIVQYESSSTNTPSTPMQKEKVHPIIMNQVFIPRFSNYVVDCGKSIRVQVPAAKPIKYESGTQTVMIYKNQSTSPSRRKALEENFSDDSLEDEELATGKKDCELDSLETYVKPVTCKSTIKSQSNENIFKGVNMHEPTNPTYRRSYDSLLDFKADRVIDRSWLPITRYPIAGTNALYEYDPNKSAQDVTYNNGRDAWKVTNDVKYQLESPNEEPSGNKIRRTDIVIPMFNGLPLRICTETTSSDENIAEDAIDLMNRFLIGSEENASSDNSLASNDGSDVTSSSETSSEDFVFYEGSRPKEGFNRQSGLGNLYTISENSELSDMTVSEPSSPQPSQHSSPQVFEQKENLVLQQSPGKKESRSGKSDELSSNKDYEVGVHVLRNPILNEMLSQESTNKSLEECIYNNHTEKYLQDGFNPHPECCRRDLETNEKRANSESDRENSFYAVEPDIPANKFGTSSRLEVEQDNQCKIKITLTKPLESSGFQNSDGFTNGAKTREGDKKNHQKQQKKSPATEKMKMNWSDVQSPLQRQFLNFNILSSSKQTPFSIDSNIFGEKKQASEAKFPSEDSITFVFMGPNRQKTSMLMEIIKRSLGQGSSSDASFGEKSHRKSRNRGVQCKLMRSISVDTAMIALSRFAKHQRPGLDITRTSSLDSLIPEELQTILEQGRLHGIRESSCQCDVEHVKDCPYQKTKSHVIKYTICTSTTRDQSTETEKLLEMTDKSSMTSQLADASCDALNEFEENIFEEYFPPLPRTKLSPNDCPNGESQWKDMKDSILGTCRYLNSDEDVEEKPRKTRKAKKSVSWSDLSECDDLADKTGSNDSIDRNDIGSSADKLDDYSLTQKNSQLDYTAQTRRVRFTEPQRSCMDDICHILHEKKEAVQTAANVTAFLNEAVQLLKNLNHISHVYELGSVVKRGPNESDKVSGEELWEPKSPLRRVETSVQTDGQGLTYKPKEISRSAESSPIRRIRTSSALADKKASVNLTWPRQRSTNSSVGIGKPPTGLKYNSAMKPSRSPLSSRATSTHSSYDVLKNDIETSSTSTNWNISNLSTTFSNSYFGDSGCSRPSSSKSFYSDGGKVDKFGDRQSKCWSRLNSKISFPPSGQENSELEVDLEDSCRRLELAVDRDRVRGESSMTKLSSLSTEKYIPASWYHEYDTDDNDRLSDSYAEQIVDRTKKSESSSFQNAGRYFDQTSILRNGKTLEMKASYTRKKPCKCYCHYRNTHKAYRSTLELEARPSLERHCHTCCIPCDAAEPERSNSTPALNSVCDSEKCRLFYYGYCPCSPIKLQHVKSSPRAYMQHLLSLRKKIVKTTYDSPNNALHSNLQD